MNRMDAGGGALSWGWFRELMIQGDSEPRRKSARQGRPRSVSRKGGDPHQPHPGTRVRRCRCSLPGLTGFTTWRCEGTDAGRHRPCPSSRRRARISRVARVVPRSVPTAPTLPTRRSRPRGQSNAHVATTERERPSPPRRRDPPMRRTCPRVNRSIGRLRAHGVSRTLSCPVERCPSGLRSTPGKCVYVNSVPRVRIPPSPPYKSSNLLFGMNFLSHPGSCHHWYCHVLHATG